MALLRLPALRLAESTFLHARQAIHSPRRPFPALQPAESTCGRPFACGVVPGETDNRANKSPRR